MSILRALERRGLERRGANQLLPWGDSTPPPPGSYGGTSSGMAVNDETAMQLAAVWGSVNLISDAISTLPIRQWLKKGTDAVEIPVAPVIERPWAEITQQDFIVQGTVSMLLRGNLWGRVVGWDADLLPAQVQLVNPRNATIRRSQNGLLEYRYWGQDVPARDVTRAMAMSAPEGIIGLSPIDYMRNVFGIARGQDLYGGAFYANSARPDGWIGVDDDLDEDETKAMLLSWLAAHQGTNKAHLPAILTGGAKFNAITMSMQDVQFLEQMQYSASVISGMIYRIPPHMLGMVDKDTSWGAGIEQQQIGFVRDTLLPWLRRWEDLMRSWLPPGEFVTFDLSERLRGDSLQRWSAYQIARVIGAMTGEEVRAAEGLPAVNDPTLKAFDQPFNSSPMKAPSSSGVGPAGDKAN